MAFPNGDIPPDRLVEVESGLYLEAGTAAAYKRMKTAAAADGVTLAIPRPAGAYRSLFVQRDMRDRPWLYNLDPTSTVPIAQAGQSTHGLGDRVDIVRGAAGDWAIRNHARFGFVREFGASDPRHFRYQSPTWAATTITPIEEDDMYTEDAERRLMDRIEAEAEKLRPVRLYQWGTGIIAVGPGGQEWIVPSQAYIDLLDYLRLADTRPVVINDSQHDFLTRISSALNPHPAAPAVDAVLKLSEGDVQDLVERIGARPVILDGVQLQQVADAARQGGAAAVSALEFVVVAK